MGSPHVSIVWMLIAWWSFLSIHVFHFSGGSGVIFPRFPCGCGVLLVGLAMIPQLMCVPVIGVGVGVVIACFMIPGIAWFQLMGVLCLMMRWWGSGSPQRLVSPVA